MHARGTGLQGGISGRGGLPSSAVRPDFAPAIAGREIGGGGGSDLTKVPGGGDDRRTREETLTTVKAALAVRRGLTDRGDRQVRDGGRGSIQNAS
jgi:hypothetical protein